MEQVLYFPMEHTYSLYSLSDFDINHWRTFIENLKAAELQTIGLITQADRDLTVTEVPHPSLRNWQGDFDVAIEGITGVVELAPDLVLCYCHVDITRDVELASQGQVRQLYTPYREHDSRVVNPRRFHEPFYIRFFPTGSAELLVLRPAKTPSHTDYAENSQIRARFPTQARRIASRLARDPMRILDWLGEQQRLNRIRHVYASLFEEETGPPDEITHTFPRDAGTLRGFQRWLARQQSQYARVELVSIRAEVTLDPAGNLFEVILRPASRQRFSVTLPQRSIEARANGYGLVTSMVYENLERES